MEPVERIEQALKERYNVRELPPHLASAVAAANSGNTSDLEAVLDGRELYRWGADVRRALTELRSSVSPAAEEPVAVVPALSDMTIAELKALAAERGVEVPIGPKAAIVDALEAASGQAEMAEALDEDADSNDE